MIATPSEFISVAGAFVVALLGAVSIVVSLFRRHTGDRSLSSFGALSLIYGTRWLIEAEMIRSVFGFPFDVPYLHALLTYVLPIPLAAFLTQIFGPGLWQSMRLVLWSSVVNAIVLIIVDVAGGTTSSDASIPIALVIVWCIVGIVNLAFPKRREATDLLVVRSGLLALFVAISHDNLMSVDVFPWSVNLSNAGFLLLCAGLGFVAVRHLLSNERALLAVEQELAIARQIQQSNLPSILSVPPGVSIAARYLPMTAVAGDFYDVQVGEHGGVGILIADVSGHGVGAALVGSMLKVAFAAQTGHLAQPAKLVAELNRTLRGKIEESFLTACYVFVDSVRRTLVYTNAGHPPPLLWKASTRTLRRLSTGGTIIGPFEDPVYKSESVKLAKGDRLVLYTDGLIEARNKSGDIFGDDQIETVVTTMATHPPDQAADLLLKALDQWTESAGRRSYEDDLTLMIVDVVRSDQR